MSGASSCATTTDNTNNNNLASRPPALTPRANSPASATARPLLRAPNPAKKVSGRDELRSAITRQAVAEQEKVALSDWSPVLDGGSAATARPLRPSPSPNPPPISMSSLRPATRADARPTMTQRTPSLDSTVSSVSSIASASQRPNGTSALRASQDTTPQDPAALIALHGSAEAALQKLLAERQSNLSQNSQLWRLVEKQRAMILGLNKDLEKSLREKERYRKKLKDHQAQSQSVAALNGSSQRSAETIDREDSQSPAVIDRSIDVSSKPGSALDYNLGARKASDSSDAMSLAAGRSDTPQNSASLASPVLPITSRSNTALGSIRDMERTQSHVNSTPALDDSKSGAINLQRVPAGAPPMSPRLQVETSGHQKTSSAASVPANLPQSAQSYSSPKTRKAPPAPLKLGPRPEAAIASIADTSDSEYEEDPESARSEHVERGRRKTREDDDREREAIVRQEESEVQRSRSLKGKQNRSKPGADTATVSAAQTQPSARAAARFDDSEIQHSQAPIFAATANPAEILRHRAISDATAGVSRSQTAPNLLSPGLPMSPRPGDRPMNSPKPRPPNGPLNSIPMSPRAGLPLSPRPPTRPIPLPPQTPLGAVTPHLDRAQGYPIVQPQHKRVPSTVEQAMPTSPELGDDFDYRPSTSSDQSIRGEIYRGLITEQHPDLLLAPNALQSILVKTASSRMRPSRNSFIAPKFDETPRFTMAVYERADRQQLWRIEKSYSMLISLDQQIRAVSSARDKYGVPDKHLFTGHAPSKIDARRQYLNKYFQRLLDAVADEKTALIVCKFLSTETIGPDLGPNADARPDSPVTIRSMRPSRAGYLTKRGKNFGGWKARYFVLDGPNFKYFEGPGGALLGSIKLQNSQIGRQQSKSNDGAEDEENQFRHAFLILEPKKKDSSSHVRHVLCAESDAERDGWVEALLQYVDYKDNDDLEPGRHGVAKADFTVPPKSPRLQKSFGEIRPGTSSGPPDPIRGVSYNDTVAGNAPTIGGPPQSPRLGHTPSPPIERANSAFTDAYHPAISRPTNLQVIQNAGDWGMRPPPTPNGKDKKRSVFQMTFNKGRSSSDLPPGEKVVSPPLDKTFIRPVFGVPLAEAVDIARVPNVDTDLPAVFYRCVEFLVAKNAVNEEGIFRLSGSTTVIKGLRERFNNEGDIDLLADDSDYDIHAVASLLKMYLRELPSTILTRELHLDFLGVLEKSGRGKIAALNALVNKLPGPNRALLTALSAFLLMVVDHSAVNKMNVRNLGVVFSPTLNVPGPLISLFVEEQQEIFGPPLAAPASDDSPANTADSASADTTATDLRSPRKQMFSDLPTPAYNQTAFQSLNGANAEDTGMTPMNPNYAGYSMAPQGDGGYGSLNDALRSPTVYGSAASGQPTPRAKKRESGMLLVNHVLAPKKKSSMSKLREEEGGSF